jgi:2-hydroxy-3-keto-5-methylthiopentenyl-1-phosphate phosphatase
MIPSVRLNFDKLTQFCKTQKIPLVIVTAGLDFVINHFLERKRLRKLVKVYAPKSRITAKGIKFSFPKLFDEASINFKDDLVRYYKRLGKKTVYIGDGFADFNAARNADFSFAIKDSKLAELLKNDRIPHKEISDFLEVVEALRKMI